jgi:hypothetical protein
MANENDDIVQTLRDYADDMITIINEMRGILEDYPDIKEEADITWVKEIKDALYGNRIDGSNLQDTLNDIEKLNKES